MRLRDMQWSNITWNTEPHKGMSFKQWSNESLACYCESLKNIKNAIYKTRMREKSWTLWTQNTAELDQASSEQQSLLRSCPFGESRLNHNTPSSLVQSSPHSHHRLSSLLSWLELWPSRCHRCSQGSGVKLYSTSSGLYWQLWLRLTTQFALSFRQLLH